MNKKVSYQQAKLLKEKGFDENCESWAYLDDNCMSMTYDSKTCVKVPTIADVVSWLYEKHGIWITSESYVKREWETVTFIYKIFRNGYVDTISRAYLGFNSPTEAYKAAIDYCLNHIV